MKNKDWLNTKTLEEEFGMAISTQARYRSEKKIPYTKIGGFIFYSREKINEWLLKHTFETEGVLG